MASWPVINSVVLSRDRKRANYDRELYYIFHMQGAKAEVSLEQVCGADLNVWCLIMWLFRAKLSCRFPI